MMKAVSFIEAFYSFCHCSWHCSTCSVTSLVCHLIFVTYSLIYRVHYQLQFYAFASSHLVSVFEVLECCICIGSFQVLKNAAVSLKPDELWVSCNLFHCAECELVLLLNVFDDVPLCGCVTAESWARAVTCGLVKWEWVKMSTQWLSKLLETVSCVNVIR